jgi:LCP family protein required for cell wall assembly
MRADADSALHRIAYVLRTPAIVVGLSLLLPGLGHAVIGKYRKALLVALPSILVALGVATVALLNRSAFFQVVGQSWLMSLLVLDMVALLYHVWAMADGYFEAVKLRPVPRGMGKWVSAVAVAALLVGTVAVHGNLAALDLQTQQTLTCVFNPDGPCIANVTPGESLPTFDQGDVQVDSSDSAAVDSTGPSGGVVSPSSMTTPGDSSAYPLPAPCSNDSSTWSERNCTLYVLLIGGDAGIGRGGNGAGAPINLRTDTMILLQVDLSTGRSAMYGIPRNLINVPLGQTDWNAYPYHFFPALSSFGADRAKLGCGTDKSPCLFNAMWVDAALYNPQKYPYPSSMNYFARGTMAVQESVGALMGVPINGTVVVDLLGFVDLINALTPNGFKISNPYEVKQIPGTPYTNSLGVHLVNLDFKQGNLTLKGEQVLAYARLRHVVGHDSDTFRMARQQLVLRSLLGQVSPCEIATNITSVQNAIRGTLWSNIPWSDAPALATIAAKIKPGNITTYGLTPANGFAENVTPDVGNTSVLQVYQDKLKSGLDGVLSAYSTSGGAGGGGGGGFSC